jgi:hypothetical protein
LVLEEWAVSQTTQICSAVALTLVLLAAEAEVAADSLVQALHINLEAIAANDMVGLAQKMSFFQTAPPS